MLTHRKRSKRGSYRRNQQVFELSIQQLGIELGDARYLQRRMGQLGERLAQAGNRLGRGGWRGPESVQIDRSCMCRGSHFAALRSCAGERVADRFANKACTRPGTESPSAGGAQHKPAESIGSPSEPLLLRPIPGSQC